MSHGSGRRDHRRRGHRPGGGRRFAAGRGPRRRGDRRRPRDLRATPLLRGAAGRPALHRGSRHHRPHLRDLPGGLPDERLRGHGGRLRGRRSTHRVTRCAGSSTAASGSRATPCTSTCSTPRTSSAAPTPSSWLSGTGPRWSGASSSSAPATWSWRRSAGGPSTRSTSGSVASTGAPTPRPSLRLAEPLRRARDAALATVEWVAGFDFPDVARRLPLRRPARRGPLPDRGRAAGRPSDGLDLSPAQLRRPGGRRARGPLHRPARPAWPGATRTSPGPWPGMRLNAGHRCPRSPPRPPPGRARPGLHQPVPQHRGAGGGTGVRLRGGAGAWSRPTYRPTRRPPRSSPRAGPGTGATEAPRGLLLHRYQLAAAAACRCSTARDWRR